MKPALDHTDAPPQDDPIPPRTRPDPAGLRAQRPPQAGGDEPILPTGATPRPAFSPSARRILFLDDDPARAEAFRIECPEMVWVSTVEECLARLGEPWDEIHLDHDLGGEILVDSERGDCGMAVVRWLCENPCHHLAATQFVIHTHNLSAAYSMLLHLQTTGYRVRIQPFGSLQPPGPARASGLPVRFGRALRAFLLRWARP